MAACDAAPEQNFAAELADFRRASFPHHAGTLAGITEGVDERFDNLLAVLRLFLRLQGVLDGRTERQPFNALGGPIRRNYLAGHSPDLLGVGLEENLEEPSAELVDDPVFECFGIGHGPKSRFGE